MSDVLIYDVSEISLKLEWHLMDFVKTHGIREYPLDELRLIWFISQLMDIHQYAIRWDHHYKQNDTYALLLLNSPKLRYSVCQLCPELAIDFYRSVRIPAQFGGREGLVSVKRRNLQIRYP